MAKTQRPLVETIADLLTQSWGYLMADVHIAIPASVLSYDYKTKKVSVQPLVKRTPHSGFAATSWPVIGSVPVEFPGSSTTVIQWPLSKGDTGLLVFADQSIDAWLSGDGSEVDPQDTRRFDATDAVFRPGLSTFKNPGKVGQGIGLEILHGGISLILNDNGTIEINGNTKGLVTWAELNSSLQTFLTELNALLATKLDGTGAPGTLALNISTAETTTVKTGG